ncbi:unnamed protein product, partial [Diplocarpon coronariae]
VALKKLIDDVSILAIERCLIQNLPDLLSPDVIMDLTDEEVQRIAGESVESVAERGRAMHKLQVLETGMAELKRLKKQDPPILETQVCDLLLACTKSSKLILHRRLPNGKKRPSSQSRRPWKSPSQISPPLTKYMTFRLSQRRRQKQCHTILRIPSSARRRARKAGKGGGDDSTNANVLETRARRIV